MWQEKRIITAAADGNSEFAVALKAVYQGFSDQTPWGKLNLAEDATLLEQQYGLDPSHSYFLRSGPLLFLINNSVFPNFLKKPHNGGS